MERCKTCKHWRVGPDEKGDECLRSEGFETRRCFNPELRFCAPPDKPNGAALEEDFTKWAKLYTAEDFGCVNHSSEKGEPR